MTKRRLSRKQKDAVIARFDGRCANCGEGGIPLEVDHRIPIWTSGREDDDNLEPLCRPCHSAKTKADVHDIAKIKRLSAKHNGTKTRRKWSRKIEGRGFDKRLSKKLSGEVVPRIGRTKNA